MTHDGPMFTDAERYQMGQDFLASMTDAQFKKINDSYPNVTNEPTDWFRRMLNEEAERRRKLSGRP